MVVGSEPGMRDAMDAPRQSGPALTKSSSSSVEEGRQTSRSSFQVRLAAVAFVRADVDLHRLYLRGSVCG